MQTFKIPTPPWMYHVIGWLIFIFYEVSLVSFVRNVAGLHSPIWSGYIFPYLINICLFYFHAIVVLRYCFSDGRKLLLFALLLLTELLLYLLFMGTTQQDGTKTGFFLSYPTKVDFVKQLWRGIYFMILSTAYWLIERGFHRVSELKEIEKKALFEEKEKQRLQLELVSAQNAFLRAQINPHLLFNTLNFVHSEVQEVSPRASEAIIILSEMMRYSLVENKADGKVALEKEAEQIENLIRINQYRFDNKLCLALESKGKLEGNRIAPLLLVPFVENLFKYADLSDRQHPARLCLIVENGVMEFSTFNKKRRTVAFSSPGIGIENVKTRLDAIYSGRYALTLEDRDPFFSVHLKILLGPIC
jgi:two-component system, LytTR family, sensor kinase